MLYIVALPLTHILLLLQHRLVGGSGGERGGGEADTLVGGIEDRVEALEEGVPVDEVKTLTGVRAEVVDNQVDGAGGSTDVSVERTGEELSIGGQLESCCSSNEEQALQV